MIPSGSTLNKASQQTNNLTNNTKTKAARSATIRSYRSQFNNASSHRPSHLQSPSKSEFIHIICRLHAQISRNALASIVPINRKEQLSITINSDHLQL